MTEHSRWQNHYLKDHRPYLDGKLEALVKRGELPTHAWRVMAAKEIGIMYTLLKEEILDTYDEEQKYHDEALFAPTYLEDKDALRSFGHLLAILVEGDTTEAQRKRIAHAVRDALQHMRDELNNVHALRDKRFIGFSDPSAGVVADENGRMRYVEDVGSDDEELGTPEEEYDGFVEELAEWEDENE